MLNVGMTRAKSIPGLEKHWKRIFFHGCHVLSIPTALAALVIVIFPLTQITDYGIVFGPIGFIATVIEVVGKKRNWFS